MDIFKENLEENEKSDTNIDNHGDADYKEIETHFFLPFISNKLLINTRNAYWNIVTYIMYLINMHSFFNYLLLKN